MVAKRSVLVPVGTMGGFKFEDPAGTTARHKHQAEELAASNICLF